MFLRFAVAERDSASGQCAGVFSAAYRLRDSERLPDSDYEFLMDLLCWFGTHLRTPRRFTKPGFPRDAAVCWFKASAHEHISMVWQIVDILERYDVLVDAIRTTRPGYVAYEDDAQVAAIPFRDTGL